jgi:hypothetical protein
MHISICDDTYNILLLAIASTICLVPLPNNLLNGAKGVNVAAKSVASGRTGKP